MSLYDDGTMVGPMCDRCGHMLPPDGKCLINHKVKVEGFPRLVGPTPGHLSECLLVSLAHAAKEWGDPWPPLGTNVAYCTCDDWSPE